MPTKQPIPFSVPAAVRTSLQSSVVNYPGQYSRVYFELDIPATVDYENPELQIESQFFVNGVDAFSLWQGGRYVDKNGNVDPAPAIEFDAVNLKSGDTVQIKMTSSTPFNWGLKNGVIA